MLAGPPGLHIVRGYRPTDRALTPWTQHEGPAGEPAGPSREEVELRSGSDPLRQLTTPETASIWLYLLPSYSWMPIVPDAGEPVSFMSVGPETPS